MNATERKKKAEENGLLVFFLVMLLWMFASAGCCCPQSAPSDMTHNECLLEQIGWAIYDQYPKILRAIE